ncbi:MAG: DUF503 domain-containing protein [bacterium]|nr:DUF503 domain-containing protein [bacterium]
MKYCVGVLTLELHLPHSHSLKERRSVVSSLKEKAAHRLNVSICEESSDSWQLVRLAFACVAQSEASVEEQFLLIRDFAEQDGRAVVINPRIEYHV